ERVQSYQTASETVDTVLNVRKNIYLTNYKVKDVDIEFLRKDTHLLIEDIESTYNKIHDDILTLQKEIEYLESFYLKQEFGEDCIVNGGVCCIDGVRVDASHQDLCQFQNRAK
ncbi:33761_t:CDS:2, partial [Racocetra persica]